MAILAPFADRAARINEAVQRSISNAVAVYQGGSAFGVQFDRFAADPFGPAVDLADIRLSFPAACAPGLAHGSEIVVDGVVYIVAGPVQSDASGWLVCNVYPKA